MEGIKMVEKIFVVKGVAEKLWATEDAIDNAIAQTSSLMSGLIEGRRELNVSAVVTDQATSCIAESMKALADARKAMIEAHAALDEVKLRVGVRTRMDGGHKPIQISPAQIDRDAI
jgi:hypothetical protein